MVPRRGVLAAEVDGGLPLPSPADVASCRRDAGLTVRDGVLLELTPPSRGVAGHSARGVASPLARAFCCWRWPLGGGACRLPRVARTGLSDGRHRRAGEGRPTAWRQAGGQGPRNTTTNAGTGRTGARPRSRAARTRTYIVSSISRISLSRKSIPFSPSSRLPRPQRRPRPHTLSASGTRTHSAFQARANARRARAAAGAPASTARTCETWRRRADHLRS